MQQFFNSRSRGPSPDLTQLKATLGKVRGCPRMRTELQLPMHPNLVKNTAEGDWLILFAYHDPPPFRRSRSGITYSGPLHISRSITAAHSIYIDLKCKPGCGTTNQGGEIQNDKSFPCPLAFSNLSIRVLGKSFLI